MHEEAEKIWVPELVRGVIKETKEPDMFVILSEGFLGQSGLG